MNSTGILEFKLDLSKTRDLAVGAVVYSEKIAVGAHSWRLWCYPRGIKAEDNGEYVSLYLDLLNSKSKNFKGIVFNAFRVGKDGAPSSPGLWFMKIYPLVGCKIFGWRRYAQRSSLESLNAVEGVVTIICTITIFHDLDGSKQPIAVPPSDVRSHLGHLLDRADGADVSLVVGGETFRAHRGVLAARSPVFRAQLFGSMAEATMSCVTLHDIEAATFRVLLRFMYTDMLPDELGAAAAGSPSKTTTTTTTNFAQKLLAAADRYDLGRLKLMCAQRLWQSVSVETVAETLGCAEMYSCPELKKMCLDYLMTGENLKKAAVTDGYFELRRDFPSVIDEIKKRLEST